MDRRVHASTNAPVEYRIFAELAGGECVMAEPNMGSVDNVSPRDVWPSEASDFTPWLAEHADLLGAALGLDIEIERSEASVGAFSLDLLGKEVGSDRVVIIENQLERTDHTHLGQLLAYAAGLDARTVIWISPDVRDEHRETIHWLNEQAPDVAFLAVELEVLRIGDSLPAPRFNVVARPSGFQRAIARPPTATDRGLAYQTFFSDFVRRAREAHPPGFSNKNPDNVRYDNWTTFGVGRTGFTIDVGFAAAPGRFRVAINMNVGKAERNLAAFEQLHSQREEIEGEFGGDLEWERLDGQVQCRIAVYREGGIDSPDAVLDEHKKWAVELVPRFRDVFAPRIAALSLDAIAEEVTA